MKDREDKNCELEGVVVDAHTCHEKNEVKLVVLIHLLRRVVSRKPPAES
jgi:hypothetical protein